MRNVIALSIILTVMTTAQPVIQYQLSMSKPQSHLFEVEVQVREYASKVIEFHMPAWRTGRYILLDFSGGVQEFSAVDELNRPLQWKKSDKDTWRVEKGSAKSIIARYKVYANEFNMRTRELNSEHGFVDPLSVFMYVENLKNKPLQLTVRPFGDWKVTTGLDEVPGTPFTFTAPNFEYFGDCPLEIGNQKDIEFYVEGIKHIISIYGEGTWNSDTLITDFTKLIIENKNLWGELPYNKYVFMIHCQPNAGGGTEHINSTIMGVRPFAFSNPSAYKGFLGLVSHEYFHTWNVKQLRPKSFAPYDLSKENYSEELWISEGATSYYDDLIMVRAKLSPASRFVDNLSNMVNNERSRFGNRIQSLAEASFDAWVKFWRNRQNAHNAQSDYYGKGAQVSLLLDLEIRHRSGNKYSLDDVLRTMYQRFPKTKGFTNSDLQKICEEFGGGSFSEFFQLYIYGVAPLPWEQSLSIAGLEVITNEPSRNLSLGVTVQDIDGKLRVTNVLPNSPAENAGVEINDEIIALNGYRFRASDFTERISSLSKEELITLLIFRNDKVKEIRLHNDGLGTPVYGIRKTPSPTPIQKMVYEQLLHTAWDEKQ